MLQAILLTSSLVLMVAMCASLMLLAQSRVRDTGEAVSAQAPEQDA
jgi:hypothetical protein